MTGGAWMTFSTGSRPCQPLKGVAVMWIGPHPPPSGAACSRAHAEEPTWKAGVARAVVTPTTPVWLAGYTGQREPDGKLHDLWVKALALEAPDGGRAHAIREVSWE